MGLQQPLKMHVRGVTPDRSFGNGTIAVIASNNLGRKLRDCVVDSGMDGYIPMPEFVDSVFRAYWAAVACEWNFAEAIAHELDAFDQQYADDHPRIYEEEQLSAKFQTLYGEITALEADIIGTLCALYDRFYTDQTIVHVSVFNETPTEFALWLDSEEIRD